MSEMSAPSFKNDGSGVVVTGGRSHYHGADKQHWYQHWQRSLRLECAGLTELFLFEQC